MKRIKVMLVDDEQDFCKTFQEDFYDTGQFEVRYANTLQHEMKDIDEYKPDIIIQDVKMDKERPSVDGEAFAYKLRKEHPEYNHIPIVILTNVIEAGCVNKLTEKNESEGIFYLTKLQESTGRIAFIANVLFRWRPNKRA